MDFENHVILYAKRWYGKSENGVIPDLSLLLSEYSNIALEHISKRDVMEFIIHAFIRTTTHNSADMFDAIREILFPLFPDKPRTPELIMIGKISVWQPDSTFPFTAQDFANNLQGKEVKGMLKTRFGDKEIKNNP